MIFDNSDHYTLLDDIFMDYILDDGDESCGYRDGGGTNDAFDGDLLAFILKLIFLVTKNILLFIGNALYMYTGYLAGRIVGISRFWSLFLVAPLLTFFVIKPQMKKFCSSFRYGGIVGIVYALASGIGIFITCSHVWDLYLDLAVKAIIVIEMGAIVNWVVDLWIPYKKNLDLKKENRAKKDGLDEPVIG